MIIIIIIMIKIIIVKIMIMVLMMTVMMIMMIITNIRVYSDDHNNDDDDDDVGQGLPTWGTCTPQGTFALFKGYKGAEESNYYCIYTGVVNYRQTAQRLCLSISSFQ